MAVYKVIETQTVTTTYTYNIEAESFEQAEALANHSDVPSTAIEEETNTFSYADVECPHEDAYCSDRCTYICSDCGEELGR